MNGRFLAGVAAIPFHRDHGTDDQQDSGTSVVVSTDRFLKNNTCKDDAQDREDEGQGTGKQAHGQGEGCVLPC